MGLSKFINIVLMVDLRNIWYLNNKDDFGSFKMWCKVELYLVGGDTARKVYLLQQEKSPFLSHKSDVWFAVQ